MDKVYDELPFDNPDGGVWKQGWEVQYDQNEVLKPENKLKVSQRLKFLNINPELNLF